MYSTLDSGLTITSSAELRGDNLSCYLNKILSVGLWNCLYDHQLANTAYLSDITVANIYESFIHKMAVKTSWHNRNYITVTLCILRSYSMLHQDRFLRRNVTHIQQLSIRMVTARLRSIIIIIIIIIISCYNASTPCFCTTLCQLTCRTSDHPTFWF